MHLGSNQRKGRKKVTANLGVTFFSPFPVAVLERKLAANRFTCVKVKKG